ncbi:MAG: hypothetical protein MJ059_08760 [Lachnospiraceae bacterium]|nr:hypothetical protein [Lachnospiraceae bacterium]
MALKRYSYIKYPYSRNGWISFALSVISLLLTLYVFVVAIAGGGSTGPFHAACGFTAVVMSLMGMWFSFLTLTEKEKNYLFGLIGGGVSLILCIVWVVVIVNGSRV